MSSAKRRLGLMFLMASGFLLLGSSLLSSLFPRRHSSPAAAHPASLEMRLHQPPLSPPSDHPSSTAPSWDEIPSVDVLHRTEAKPACQGMVLDEDDRSPVAGVSLDFFMYNWYGEPAVLEVLQHHHAITDADGYFSVSLAPGDYDLYIRPPLPYSWQAGRFTAEQTMTILLPKGLTLEGIVQDTRGNPLNGAQVFLLVGGCWKLLGNFPDPAAVTDALGRYSIKGVPRHQNFASDGRFQSITVFALHPPYSQLGQEAHEFDDTLTTVFSLDPIIMTDSTYNIMLHSSDSSLAKANAFHLSSSKTLPGSPNRLERTLEVDSASHGLFSSIPPGDYTLKALCDNCATWIDYICISNHDVIVPVSLRPDSP